MDTLIFQQLGSSYATLTPWVEALLRVVTGLALVPHGLRITFGIFKNSGIPIDNLSLLQKRLDAGGYRPGWFWAPAISITQLVAGPLLALGLFTRAAALPITLFLIVSNVQRWRVGGYFYEKKGAEYTFMWTAAALYFLAKGGGLISLDHILMIRAF
jgi:putative oxidoreductase